MYPVVTEPRCNLTIIVPIDYMYDSFPSWGAVIDHFTRSITWLIAYKYICFVKMFAKSHARYYIHRQCILYINISPHMLHICWSLVRYACVSICLLHTFSINCTLVGSILTFIWNVGIKILHVIFMLHTFDVWDRTLTRAPNQFHYWNCPPYAYVPVAHSITCVHGFILQLTHGVPFSFAISSETFITDRSVIYNSS